jgi:hypothetical protein
LIFFRIPEIQGGKFKGDDIVLVREFDFLPGGNASFDNRHTLGVIGIVAFARRDHHRRNERIIFDAVGMKRRHAIHAAEKHLVVAVLEPRAAVELLVR